ncbi:MAG: LysR family transcriptional regulator [Devosiaceae bacterium]
MQNKFKDWGDVRIFLAVMREGSTLAAARLLDINQTTVARRINVLEHTLGLKLFEKTTRGACPTDAARQLEPFAQALADAAAAFEAEALAEKQRPKPPIRITAFDQDLMGNIGKVVTAFVDENPDISFEFIASERILDLCKGEADIALRMTAAITDERLVARKVGVNCWTYYASKTYAKMHGTPDAFTENMEPHRVALFSHIKSNRANVMRCSGANEMITVIKKGQAIGPLPITEGDSQADLVRCFEPPEGSELPVWLVTSPDAHKREEVRRFTAFAAPIITRNLKSAQV